MKLMAFMALLTPSDKAFIALLEVYTIPHMGV